MTRPKTNPDRTAENIQQREISSRVEGAPRRFTAGTAHGAIAAPLEATVRALSAA